MSTWITMTTVATTRVLSHVSAIPNWARIATAILTGKYVLTPIQPRVIRNISALGRYAPRRPNAERLSTIWLTPVLWPITVKAAKIAHPMMLPTTTTAIVSQSPKFSMMPNAPRAQLIGAMLAPAQIHICWGPVESLSASGMGSMLWTSTLSSARVSVAIDGPPCHTKIWDV